MRSLTLTLHAAHTTVHTLFDLSLATLQVIITAHVAYAACMVLGGVLQTTPAAPFGSMSGIGTKGTGIGAKGMGMSSSRLFSSIFSENDLSLYALCNGENRKSIAVEVGEKPPGDHYWI
ncbi:hypothetical protein BDR03DRAFT_123912 [Suillus americanus]|nr:hypothetical protein BDR03DRAFT_123912 [Suillus americanus]